MELELPGKDLQTLLALYNHEINAFKQKLLDGEPWENLQIQRRNLIRFAMAIEKLHNYSRSKNIVALNPA